METSETFKRLRFLGGHIYLDAMLIFHLCQGYRVFVACGRFVEYEPCRGCNCKFDSSRIFWSVRARISWSRLFQVSEYLRNSLDNAYAKIALHRRRGAIPSHLRRDNSTQLNRSYPITQSSSSPTIVLRINVQLRTSRKAPLTQELYFEYSAFEGSHRNQPR